MSIFTLHISITVIKRVIRSGSWLFSFPSKVSWHAWCHWFSGAAAVLQWSKRAQLAARLVFWMLACVLWLIVVVVRYPLSFMLVPDFSLRHAVPQHHWWCLVVRSGGGPGAFAARLSRQPVPVFCSEVCLLLGSGWSWITFRKIFIFSFTLGDLTSSALFNQVG